MDFSAILHKSASSSATETEKCSSNESLLQAIDSELKRIGHVEETPSEFTIELNRDFNKGGRAYVVLTKEFQGELVEVDSSYFFVPHFDFEEFNVTISKHSGSSLAFKCSYTPDGIEIWDITVDDGDQYLKLPKTFLCLLCCKPMAFCAILRKSASSLALASSHLNRKPTLGSFVPDFEFSSATETKKCSSNIESLLQLAINSEINAPEHHVVLTREYRGELVEVLGYIRSYTTGEDRTDLFVTISNNGESFLKFQCFCTSDSISIRRIGIINSKYLKDDWPYNDGDDVVEFDNMDESSYMDENLKKAFFEYLEIRGIKPSIVDFMIKCYRHKKAIKNVDGVEED
ncbi:hypothetical protein Q3G72_034207 [Acer saccharum]|nr:hypothetical protein Q3G72_034207 [Acer saccharum]